eukprot:Gregarina_sp_Pseudo_9__5816@NODE_884_length_2099_cov_5_787864_g830_i0_p5_GENE_NODE_884_length_2099_cov_5_787864_g830_i0NODE_884_length_2099_cov_5_787864_g830_i0_p5_ORF_typecomplete_len107_score2_97YmaF/PF12788_7/0_11_NODE_884_length_2099_cov_5_787864_g830_i011831503
MAERSQISVCFVQIVGHRHRSRNAGGGARGERARSHTRTLCGNSDVSYRHRHSVLQHVFWLLLIFRIHEPLELRRIQQAVVGFRANSDDRVIPVAWNPFQGRGLVR